MNSALRCWDETIMASASDGRILSSGEAKLQEMKEWRVKRLQNNSAHNTVGRKNFAEENFTR